MDRGRERKLRTIYRSTDGGETWHKTSALEGSVIYEQSLSKVYNDGFGSLYSANNPNEKGK